MLVKQVLGFADLGVAPLWGPAHALERTVTGVTTADMENPANYLSPGEIVLTGLIWWHPNRAETAEAFVAEARAAGTVALIAGEGLHGQVPDELVEACRAHDLPLFSVPRSTTFRTIVDRIYSLLWTDLREPSVSAALPSAVENELLERIASAVPLCDVLSTAVERLGLPDLELVSAADRTIASSNPHIADQPRRVRIPVGRPGGRSPFDGWWLCTRQPADAAQRPVLGRLADLLSASVEQREKRRATHAAAASALLADLDRGDTAAMPDLIRKCGLPADVELTPLVVRMPGAPGIWAVDAHHELLATCAAEFVVCEARTAESVGIAAAPPEQLARQISAYLPTVQGLVDDDRTIAVGLGPSVEPRELIPALASARYAAGAAGTRPASTKPRVCATSEMTTLSTVLEGLPAPVAQTFRSATIGPITRYDVAKGTRLLETLKTFLDSGASWTRTATAMHLHVNTVHYRIERVEALTGRRVANLHDRIDLQAALILHLQSNTPLP
ncbi:PucR family transcriptional regulator [Saccharopolyspora shandongensis]|uniref:PucR family transcriptional regulator n=1 Tax=Saccharopolyspora shandongensis TaxID=418495 RepID=UPI00342C5178